MKKILTFILALVMMLTLSTIAFATSESTDMSTDVITEEDTAEGIIQETTDRVSKWLTGFGISGAIVLFVTVIGFVAKNFKRIKLFFDGLKTALVAIFSADGKNLSNVPKEFSALKQEFDAIASSFNEELKNNEHLIEDLQATIDKQNHIISAFIINSSLVNPYAKAEIMKMMCGEQECGKTVEETLANVNKAVEKARELEDRPETPFIDKVVNKAEEEV